MSAHQNCAVIIPVYQKKIRPLEQIALKQCQSVLSGYDITVVKPKSLNLEDCEVDFSFITNQLSFDDVFFEGIKGYNSLMLSAEFYARFLGYEYILIYQLDAFVFKNDLHKWCSEGWDYVGAPWFRKKQFESHFKNLKERIRCYYHRRYNPLNKEGLPDSERQMTNQVGNGGLSLRKTKRFHELCIQHRDLIDFYLSKDTSHYNEDLFWSIELNRKNKVLNIPSFKQAVHFAVETEPERAFTLLENDLPFGCHAWDKNLGFWRPYIEASGYSL